MDTLLSFVVFVALPAAFCLWKLYEPIFRKVF